MMEDIVVRVINNSNNDMPAYATQGSAGMDLRAFISEPVILQPLQRIVIPTGISIALPQGYEAQIRPRSGLAAKSGVTVLNTPGTIDSDYRGDISVIMINLSDEPFVINNGDRICQMVISKYEVVSLLNVDSLDDTQRGEGGFGHTGVK